MLKIRITLRIGKAKQKYQQIFASLFLKLSKPQINKSANLLPLKQITIGKYNRADFHEI